MAPRKLPIRRPCEALTKAGDPCKSYAVPETNPPRCSRHPFEARPLRREADAARQKTAKETFLRSYAEHGSKEIAAAEAGQGVSTLHEWKARDAQFYVDWENARIGLIDRVEYSLFEQAIGVETMAETTERVPIKHDDGSITFELKVTKTVRTTARSTQAAALWLRGNDPLRYRDSRHVQPDQQRRPEDEDLVRNVLSDPALAAALDAAYDADLNDE